MERPRKITPASYSHLREADPAVLLDAVLRRNSTYDFLMADPNEPSTRHSCAIEELLLIGDDAVEVWNKGVPPGGRQSAGLADSGGRTAPDPLWSNNSSDFPEPIFTRLLAGLRGQSSRLTVAVRSTHAPYEASLVVQAREARLTCRCRWGELLTTLGELAPEVTEQELRAVQPEMEA